MEKGDYFRSCHLDYTFLQMASINLKDTKGQKANIMHFSITGQTKQNTL